jgi:predicted acetylornithine/succinylornithine family transaminase
MNTYARFPVMMVRGEGSKLIDSDGKEYIDLLAGVAVVAVGHSNQKVAESIAKQAKILNHVSNYFWNQPACDLACKLNTISRTPDMVTDYTVFFVNSGTESIECALKLARKWGKGRYKIVAAENSFHGRTFGALAATGQPKKWEGFLPLVPGFVHKPLNDLKAWQEVIDDDTVALLVEPIQGEGGINPSTREFLHGLRELCDRHSLLLIFDEIQSGCARTGDFWAWQGYGVVPDIFTVAKGLANGVPIGACLARRVIGDHFVPGNHGSTFGGGALATAAALATIAEIEERKLGEHALKMEQVVRRMLQSHYLVKEVRGRGLMLGVELKVAKSEALVQKLFKRGVIANSVTPSVIRITPPLVICEEELVQGINILVELLSDETLS